MNERIRYHIRRSVIRQGIYLLSCWGICAVWSLLVTRGGSDFDGTGLLRLYILSGLIEILYCIWSAFRFVRMIRQQEKASGVPFDDADALPFSKHSLNSVSGDWFIQSGAYAFHRSCIADIFYKHNRHGRVNRRWGTRVFLQTTYGESYRFWIHSNAEAEKFMEWSGYEGI